MAIVLEGKIQLVDEADVAITPPITPLKPGTSPQPSAPFQTKIQGHSKFVMRTGSFRMAKTPSAPQDVILEEGHVLQERLAEAVGGVKRLIGTMTYADHSAPISEKEEACMDEHFIQAKALHWRWLQGQVAAGRLCGHASDIFRQVTIPRC